MRYLTAPWNARPVPHNRSLLTEEAPSSGGDEYDRLTVSLLPATVTLFPQAVSSACRGGFMPLVGAPNFLSPNGF